MHHLDIWIKIDQLYVTCFIISLFNAQHISNVSTSIFRSLRIIVDLSHVLYCSGSMCVGVTAWFGWVVWYPYAGWSTSPWDKYTISRKLLKMDVLTFETCWAVNSEIIKHVTPSWSSFIQIPSDLFSFAFSLLLTSWCKSVLRSWQQYNTARRFIPCSWDSITEQYPEPAESGRESRNYCF